MAKSPIKEVHSLTLEGILDLNTMTMEFDEIGKKDLKNLLEKFDEESVTVTIKLKNDITE